MYKGGFPINLSILVVLLIALAGQGLIAAEEVQSNPSNSGMRILSTGQFDGNRIHSDLENNGMIVSHRISGHSGLEWPRGSNKYAVYASGIWIAGLVNNEIRIAAAEYSPELTSGPFGSDGSELEHVLYKVNFFDINDPTASPDFQNWPAEYGAPFNDAENDGVYLPMPEGLDSPDILGDQMIWYVSNDAVEANHTTFASAPLGIEVQTSIWGYDRNDALGNMMFVRALIINKGENQISDTYIGLWSDPDIGDAGDDFVGCDTLLGLGFAYNDGADGIYTDAAPAVGYDFFQGPIVPAPGESATAFGRTIPDHKNLKMSSFVKYINGDDIYTDPNSAEEAYNYMKGFLRDGSNFINSATGEIAWFVHPDDPNDNVDGTDNVWVDGDDNAADDRRFLMNSGPFEMAPGDSQEVIYGILMSQGVDALSSVTKLKNDDGLAQAFVDNNYSLPEDTIVVPIFAEIDFPTIEADNLNDNGIANNGELIRLSFLVMNTTNSIASFNLQVMPLSSLVSDEGQNNSIQIDDLQPQPYAYLLPEEDQPLFYIAPQFFEDHLDFRVYVSMSGSMYDNEFLISIPVEVLDYQPDPSVYWIENISGNTSGSVGFRVVNPSGLTNDSYQVTFSDEFFNATGAIEPGLGINLMNSTTSTILVDRHSLPEEHQFGFPVTEGFKLLASDPPVGVKGIFQVSNASGEIPNGVSEDASEDVMWIHYLAASGYTTEQAQGGWFFVTHGGGTANDPASFNARVLRGSNWERVSGRIFEMRFTDDALSNGLAYRRFSDGVITHVPFELWNLGVSAQDTEDDFRMLPAFLSGGSQGSADNEDNFDFWGDDQGSSSSDDPSSDWIYWGNPVDETPGQSGYDTFFALGPGGVADDGVDWTEVLARTRLMNWNGSASHLDSLALSRLSSVNPTEWNAQDTSIFLDSGWFLDEGNNLGNVIVSGGFAFGTILHLPEIGTIHRWVANRPLNSSVSVQFNMNDILTDLAEDLLPSVYCLAQNYPNPFNPMTTIKYQLAMTGNVQLVIYDLLGRQVRLLSDDVQTQGWHAQVWDGKDASGHLVSSGMYLYRLKAGTFSKTMKMLYLR